MPDLSHPKEVHYTKGSFIIVEGKPSADKFYLIKKGRVQIIRETDEIMTEQHIAGPGEMFGVISAIASRGYIESAVALSDVSLMAVDRSLVCNTIPVAVNIIKQFSQRLRKLNETFSRQLMKEAASEDPSHLMQVGKYYEKAGKINQALYAYSQYLAYCPGTGYEDDVKQRMRIMAPHATIIRPKYSPDTMVQNYPKGCLLFAEGETGNNLFIIQEGLIKITKIIDKQEVVLAVLKKGDIFGEMAMLENKPRNATAEVYEKSTLLAVNRSNFTSLVNEQPDMVIRLTTLMAERIWFRYRQITNTLINNSLGRLYDALLVQLEKDRVDLTSTKPHLCNFGFKELVAMAGVPESKTTELYNKVSSARRLTIENDKVLVHNSSSILKEAEYYHRARKMGKDISDK